MRSDKSRAPCLKIPKNLGEKAISIAKGMRVFNHDLKIECVGDNLCIPLVREPSSKEKESLTQALSSFEFIGAYVFSKRHKRHLDLAILLKDKLPTHLLARLPHAIDFIGTIAVLEIPPELESYKAAIGDAVMVMNKRLQTVLSKAGSVNGLYRVRKFVTIAGANETQTIHKEYGCIFYVDLAKAYFSPRLSHEHDRIASLVREAETIIDMFAGVGSFSIMIAKRHEDAKVYAIDINPGAIYCLNRNILLNHVEKNVESILGDSRQIIEERLVGFADRIIMNLPEKAIEYVDVACRALKPEGGVLHFYSFESEPEALERAIMRLTAAVKQAKRKVEKPLCGRLVKAKSPFVWQVAVDVKIS